MRSALAFLILLLIHGAAIPASVDGLAIRSTVQGSGNTIIFVHGWTCDESSWDAQVAKFKHGYRVVTLDLPGHGASDSPTLLENYSLHLFAGAVEAVRAEIGAQKIVLVGHSMGALVIYRYAAEHPNHVAGLVSVDGSLDQREWNKGEPQTETMTRQMRAEIIDNMFVKDTPKLLRDRIRSMMMGASSMTAQGASDAIHTPTRQSTGPMMVPALTVWADKSKPTFDTKELLPRWEETRLYGAGHFLMMERPDTFNEILFSFVSERAEF